MSKQLPIVTYPDPNLRKKSKEVDLTNLNKKDFIMLIDNMVVTMQKCDGVGLAAPQIGKNIRIIIVTDNKEIIEMINPVITKKSFSKETAEEGCLSVPAFYGQVERSKWVHCEYNARSGKKVKIKAEGLFARVIQHEVDHLDGILFIDNAVELKELAVNKEKKSK